MGKNNELKKKRVRFRFLSIAIIGIFLLNVILPSGVLASDINQEEKIDVIVLYKNKVPEPKKGLFGILNTSNEENVNVLKSLPIKTMTIPVSELDQLRADPNVVSVSLDQEIELLQTETEELSAQELEVLREIGPNDWNNDMIKGFDAWDDGYTGNGVRVAVLDTGFSEHKDMTYAGGYSTFAGQSWQEDGDGHGTHVAGIVGATENTFTQGIAPGSDIYGVKVFEQFQGKEYVAAILPSGDFTLDMGRRLEAGEELVLYQEDGQHKSDEITFRVHHNGGDDFHLTELSSTSNGTLGNVSNLLVINEGKSISGKIDGVFDSSNTVVAKDEKQYNVAPLSNVLDGLDWAIQENMDIVNMSIGSHTYSLEFELLVNHGLNNGTLIVASSGNDGNSAGTGDVVLYPAKYEGAIAVSAVDENMERPSFSATGAANELAAPGAGIGGLGLNDDYVLMSGTSQASPHVTGLAAILMEKFPELSANEIRSLLIQNTIDLGEEGRDTHFGHGLIQYGAGVVEPEAPIIDYNGELEITIGYGEAFTFPAVSVIHESEEIEAVLTIMDEDGNEIDQADFSTISEGTYTLTYRAVDSHGNQAEDLVIILVVLPFEDTEAPVIEYDGEVSIEIEYGSVFEMPLVTVSDNVDQDLEATLQITNAQGETIAQGEFNTELAGTYTFTYTAKDSSGNEAENLVLTIIINEFEDTEAPVIDYNGDDPMILEFGEAFTVPVINVSDNHDPNPTYIVELIDEDGNKLSNIDTEVPGNYTLIYTATDQSGNKSEKVIAIVVKQEDIPLTPIEPSNPVEGDEDELEEQLRAQIDELFALAIDLKSISHLDAAMELIQELPDGEDKEMLINTFNELKFGTTDPAENQIPVWTKAEINMLLEEIENDLENAESSLNLVEEMINNLPASEEKSSLLTRLEALRASFDAIQEEDETPIIPGDEPDNDDEQPNGEGNDNQDKEGNKNNGITDDGKVIPVTVNKSNNENKPADVHAASIDENKEKANGEILPVTATNMYQWLFLGGLFIVMGLIFANMRKTIFGKNKS